MKTSSTAFFVGALLVATSAYGACTEKQCSAVKMKVASCKPAALKVDGTLSSSPVNKKAGDFSGTLIRGVAISERAVACYSGSPDKSGAPDDKGPDFLMQLTDLSCEQLIGKVLVGRTAHPCCDIPPAPGETRPGTCNTQVRLLGETRILNNAARRKK